MQILNEVFCINFYNTLLTKVTQFLETSSVSSLENRIEPQTNQNTYNLPTINSNLPYRTIFIGSNEPQQQNNYHHSADNSNPPPYHSIVKQQTNPNNNNDSSNIIDNDKF